MATVHTLYDDGESDPWPLDGESHLWPLDGETLLFEARSILQVTLEEGLSRLPANDPYREAIEEMLENLR